MEYGYRKFSKYGYDLQRLATYSTTRDCEIHIHRTVSDKTVRCHGKPNEDQLVRVSSAGGADYSYVSGKHSWIEFDTSV